MYHSARTLSSEVSFPHRYRHHRHHPRDLHQFLVPLIYQAKPIALDINLMERQSAIPSDLVRT